MPTRTSYVNRFRGGLVFKAHRLVHHSTLGVRVIKKKKLPTSEGTDQPPQANGNLWGVANLLDVINLQGYLTYKKTHPPRTLP